MILRLNQDFNSCFRPGKRENVSCLKNMNASRPSEHPTVRGGNFKLLFLTFSVLVANPKKTFNTVANPASGLLVKFNHWLTRYVWSLHRPNIPLDSTRPFWRATENDSVIRQFHGGVRACVGFDDKSVRGVDDRVCAGWFAVKQGLREGCVLAPLLLNIFAAVRDVAYTRFKVDKDIMDALGASEKEKGGGGAGGSNCRRASPGDAALGDALR